jgi:hypothetical protein
LPLSVFLVVLILVLVAIVGHFIRRRGRPSVGALRDEWGKPIERWRELDSIGEYHRWRASLDDGRTYLDDRTWSDLHLDLVFAAVDRTRSTVGRQLLYHRLRCSPTEQELGRFERLVQHFSAREEDRSRAQLLLARLSHPAGYRLWRICQADSIDVPLWYGLFPLLGLAAVGSVIGYWFWPRALLVLLVVAIINIVLRVKLWSQSQNLLGPFRQVGPLLECARGILAEPRVAEIVDARQVASLLRSVESLGRSTRWASREFTMENELAASAWEYLNVLFLIDANSMLFAARRLRRSGDSLLSIIELLGEVDAAISTASLRVGPGIWTIPDLTEPGRPMALRDARHPLIESAVPNSIVMSPGQGLVITGSNMSGKSTFLRTIGVAVVTAQTLNTCPAAAYSGPRLKVRSAMGHSDDLIMGKSYYLTEVDAVLELLRESESPEASLFLFDEIFRGTNTNERLAAGEAVLQALPLDATGEARHIVLAATHDIELVRMLSGTYVPYYFEESVRPGGLTFDYEIRPGQAQTRNAIALLEARGAPAEIIERARRRVAELDSRQS